MKIQVNNSKRYTTNMQLAIGEANENKEGKVNKSFVVLKEPFFENHIL